MPDIGAPTLDQIRVFLAVVETGSFSAAARKLNRRQSVISYTIANLEQQLGGLSLFDRRTRRPALTEAGRAILGDSRRLTSDLDGLQARARGLLRGLEAEVALAVDVMLPTCQLVAALTGFREAFPTVTLRLYTEALGSVTRLVLDRVCTIGASGPLPGRTDELISRPLGAATIIPVAAPSHPLAATRGPVSSADVRDHVQLVLTDRSNLTEGADFGVLSPQTWRLADLGAKYALLLQGLGWGGMPEHQVRADLSTGRLVQLDLPAFPAHRYSFSGLHRADSPPGPAALWLLDRLGSEVGAGEPETMNPPSVPALDDLIGAT
jgi:DNA-binding transcriptional LysR family regulator